MNLKITRYSKLIEESECFLCDHCLGRAFSKLVKGENNRQRGQIVKKSLNDHGDALNTCYICNNVFYNLDSMIGKIINKIEGVEFSTFLVGSRLSPDILKREEEIHEKMDFDVENIKKEINREIGKILSSKIKKEADFSNPHIVIMADFIDNKVNVQINPLFIEGRYRKLIRGIPQTKWPCNKCKGKGCVSCDYTGQMYPQSVELLISPPALEASSGSDSKFHGVC